VALVSDASGGPFTRMRAILPVALALLPASACLVTNKIDFEVNNHPSEVLGVSPAVFSSVPIVAEPCPDPDKYPDAWMAFTVQVSDRDVDEDLTGRTLVNGNIIPLGGIESIPHPADKSVERPPQSFCLTYADLNKPCNHVEFLVATHFRDPPYKTDDPSGSYGRTEWFVLGPNSPDEVGEGCRTLFDGGM
jgi:hypothetical protein